MRARRLRRFTLGPGLLALFLALSACALGEQGSRDVRLVTIVSVSDWHGQVEPLSVSIGGARREVGGAAVLKAYFNRERRRNPGGTLVVTGGSRSSSGLPAFPTSPLTSWIRKGEPWRRPITCSRETGSGSG